MEHDHLEGTKQAVSTVKTLGILFFCVSIAGKVSNSDLNIVL